MKPSTKFQKLLIPITEQIPSITETQEQWAYDNCFTKYGFATKKQTVCMECGNAFEPKVDVFTSKTILPCPHCNKHLEIFPTLKRKARDSNYVCFIDTFKGYQVIRMFDVLQDLNKERAAMYKMQEVVQHWIDKDGKTLTKARLKPGMYGVGDWDWSSKLELRQFTDSRNINPRLTYPIAKIIPTLKRNGFKNKEYKYNYPFYDIFIGLLSNKKLETLYKAKMYSYFEYFLRGGIDDYWAPLKICMRNGYKIADFGIWRDYINTLKLLGKDLHNASYVCPVDLNKAHDIYMNKRLAYNERQAKIKKRLRLVEDEETYNKEKSKFLDLSFSNGSIDVVVLKSVQEFITEGNTLYHCVYKSDYHLKPNSLILSARMDGMPIETIEVNLTEFAIEQCRGFHNKNTEFHDEIISLVNKNMKLIKAIVKPKKQRNVNSKEIGNICCYA